MQTHPSSSEADREPPRLLSALVEQHPEIRGALIFTYDGLINAFSSGMAFEDAERLAPIANTMRQYSTEFGRKANLGKVETLVVRRTTDQLLILEATPYSGVAVFVERKTHLKSIITPLFQMIDQLVHHLPGQAPGARAPASMGVHT